MKGKRIIKAIISAIVYLGVLLNLSNCQKTNAPPYPPLLQQAIDLFFIENKNDSILQLLAHESLKTEPEGIQSAINIFRAAALCESGRADSAAILLEKIEPNKLNPYNLYYYHSIAGLIAFRLNNYQQASRIISTIIAQEVYDARCLALNERLRGRVMVNYENYELAIQHFHESTELYSKSRLPKSVAINQKFMASVYIELGAFDEASRLIEEAENIFIQQQDQEELFYLYIVGIKLYVHLNHLKTAQEYINKAMQLDKVNLDGQMLSSIYTYQGRIEELNKNYPEAIRAFENVLHIDEVYFGSERTKSRAYIHLSRLHNELTDFRSAERYANLSLQSIGDEGHHFLRHQAYRELSISVLQTDPEKARQYIDSSYTNFERYHELSSMGIVEFMNTRFQLEDKVAQLKHLQDRQKENRILNYLIAIIVCLIVAALLVVAKLRKKINNTLSALVKKNLSQIRNERQVSELIQMNEQIQQSKSRPTENHHLTSEQKDYILYTNFKNWLEKDKQYLRNDLDLNTAARELGTNRSYLSKAINSQGTRFTELINKYRVREVLRIFENENDARNSYSLQEISAAAGFHTKSVFFDAFRKETGMTPNQFKEHLRYDGFSGMTKPHQ